MQVCIVRNSAASCFAMSDNHIAPPMGGQGGGEGGFSLPSCSDRAYLDLDLSAVRSCVRNTWMSFVIRS